MSGHGLGDGVPLASPELRSSRAGEVAGRVEDIIGGLRAVVYFKARRFDISRAGDTKAPGRTGEGRAWPVAPEEQRRPSGLMLVPSPAPCVDTLAELARLREENTVLRESASTFGALAERLSTRMKSATP